MVLPTARAVSPLVTDGQTTVALRVPAHPVFQFVLRQFGQGLAAPSANPFGRISPTCAAHVQYHLAGRIAVVDGGPYPVGIESTIVDLSGNHPRILRAGAITAGDLARHLTRVEATATSAPRVPGTLASHYAPRKPCYRIPADLAEPPFRNRRLGLLAHRPAEWPVARYLLGDAGATGRLCARAVLDFASGRCKRLRRPADRAAVGRTFMGRRKCHLLHNQPLPFASRISTVQYIWDTCSVFP